MKFLSTSECSVALLFCGYVVDMNQAFSAFIRHWISYSMAFVTGY